MDHPNLLETLRALTSARGPSGFEATVGQVAAELLRPYCDTVEIDVLGNVVGSLRCPRKDAPTLLLDAHLDQIGFIVSEVTKEGFLRVRSLGGVDERMLPACDAVILTDPPRFGVFTSKPPHLQKADETDKSIPLTDLFIDAGLSEGDEEAVPVGSAVVFAEEMARLSDGTVTGKALDDRAGITAILYALSLLQGKELPVHLKIVFSVGEELSCVGAGPAADRLAPDCALAVDVSHAKTPDAPADKTFAFGGGPMIGAGPNLHRGLEDKLIRLAEEHQIPWQLEVMEGNTGTNAWPMQISRAGVPCALLSIPLRYMHTPIETIALDDLTRVGQLMALFIEHFDGGDLHAF